MVDFSSAAVAKIVGSLSVVGVGSGGAYGIYKYRDVIFAPSGPIYFVVKSTNTSPTQPTAEIKEKTETEESNYKCQLDGQDIFYNCVIQEFSFTSGKDFKLLNEVEKLNESTPALTKTTIKAQNKYFKVTTSYSFAKHFDFSKTTAQKINVLSKDEKSTTPTNKYAEFTPELLSIGKTVASKNPKTPLFLIAGVEIENSTDGTFTSYKCYLGEKSKSDLDCKFFHPTTDLPTTKSIKETAFTTTTALTAATEFAKIKKENYLFIELSNFDKELSKDSKIIFKSTTSTEKKYTLTPVAQLFGTPTTANSKIFIKDFS